MTEPKRFLLVLTEPQDGTQMLLEVADQQKRDIMQKQAEAHGLKCSLIGLDEYDRVTYRGCRYFDLRNPFTLKNFQLDDWVDFLNHWDENERGDEYGEYKM